MIRNIFANHGITITEEQEQKLNQYYDLLIDWNNKINLTIRNPSKYLLLRGYGIEEKTLQCNVNHISP